MKPVFFIFLGRYHWGSDPDGKKRFLARLRACQSPVEFQFYDTWAELSVGLHEAIRNGAAVRGLVYDMYARELGEVRRYPIDRLDDLFWSLGLDCSESPKLYIRFPGSARDARSVMAVGVRSLSEIQQLAA